MYISSYIFLSKKKSEEKIRLLNTYTYIAPQYTILRASKKTFYNARFFFNY